MGTKKLLPMVSHDLWARNQKIVIHGIWNPRAWFEVASYSAKCVFSFFFIVFMKAKQQPARRGWHLWCNRKSQGLSFFARKLTSFSVCW